MPSFKQKRISFKRMKQQPKTLDRIFNQNPRQHALAIHREKIRLLQYEEEYGRDIAARMAATENVFALVDKTSFPGTTLARKSTITSHFTPH